MTTHRKLFLASLRVEDLDHIIGAGDQSCSVPNVLQSKYDSRVPLQTTLMRMTQTPLIEPLPAPNVSLARSGLPSTKQLEHAIHICCFPGGLGKIHLCVVDVTERVGRNILGTLLVETCLCGLAPCLETELS